MVISGMGWELTSRPDSTARGEEYEEESAGEKGGGLI